MRKSAAPSRVKFISPLLNQNSTVTSAEKLSKIVKPQSGVRSTSSVLNILKKFNSLTQKVKQELPSKSIADSENVSENPQKENVIQSIGKRIYSVVWGKKSTKKHKTWEGDGFLEVGTNSAVLKDENGTEMGRATNIKTELIEDGYILSVGSKEVQVIELSENPPVFTLKRPAEDDAKPTAEKSVKKQKSTGIFLNLLGTTKVVKRKSINSNFKELIMPQPPSEHQWTHNVNKKTVNDVSVDPCLAKVLRPHQRCGVVFLYECVMGFKDTESFGAILADEMGLGKTLQCITLVWTLLKQGPYGQPIISRALVVTPSSLTGNWENEFASWLGREKIRTFVVTTKNKPKNYVPIIPVVIISYEMFVRYFEDLNEINFDLVICDEGHRLKNNSIKAAQLLSQLNCNRRIILTGTPIQNDLQEFYCLSNFVNPNCLGTNLEYKRYFEDYIVASRELNAPENVKVLGTERALELNKKTNHFILRRTQEVLDKYLPVKYESVIFVKCSEVQKTLYSAAVNYWENRDVSAKDVTHLSVINALKKICNHPVLLLQKNNTLSEEQTERNLYSHLQEILSNHNILTDDDSGKIKILFSLLSTLKELGEKIVIVSSFTQTLDMISQICDKKSYKYSRLDGNVASTQRTKIVESFNSVWNQDFVFLLSAKAGGVGLNLVGASRLVLFDSDWNPATDLQAMSRVWRDGQKKSVFLYRFLTAGTIEEKIYQRQISKTGLSGAIVDPTNATKSIRLSDEELKDLFNPQFEEDSSTHNILNCKCSCNGTVPEPDKKEEVLEYDRKCQLGVKNASDTSQSLKMNQLMQWEHHKQPFDDQIIKNLGLSRIGNDISFIFRNTCSL